MKSIPIELNHKKDEDEEEGSDSKVKRKAMLLSNDDSESNKSVDSKNNQEDAKIAEPKQPIKKGTSKFYPKAKGLHPENKDEDNKLEEVENDTKVNIDSMQEEDEGKDQKNKELKLSHKNIAAFYPKENAKEGKSLLLLKRLTFIIYIYFIN